MRTYTNDRQQLIEDLQYLRNRLEPHWSITTMHPKTLERCSGEEPRSTGQCAVSALIVQYQLGGSLIKCSVQGYTHWINLIDGWYCDITGDQFDYAEVTVTKSLTPLYSYIEERHEITDKDTIKRAKILANHSSLRFFEKDINMPTDLPDLVKQRHPVLDKDGTLKGTMMGVDYSFKPKPGGKLARILDILFEEPEITITEGATL